MAGFELCADCLREYSDPADRRFHAQPIACPVCGPRLDVAVADAARELDAGRIVALKGVGGFQLLVDAGNGDAVARLRERKKRDAKPFALMLPDMEAVRRWCRVSAEEERVLASSAAPIVLLAPSGEPGIAAGVSDGSPYHGVMLPYSPLHHLLLRAFPHPVVATSGNLSGDPIAVDNEEARRRLGRIADVFVTHDRPVARPCDDSVVRVQRGRECVLRRARGYAPLPVRVNRSLPRVLAVGGHLKNSVAIAVDRNVYVSQHVGDLESLESRRAFENAIGDLCRLYRFEPELVACDLHPGYASTKWAQECALPVVAVQHHHAHAAACAAENDVPEPYLAVTWDGTGYGLDETVWGGEFFAVSGGRFERVAHLRPFRLPGGGAAVEQGWRCAEALLFETGMPARHETVRRMLERGVNSPVTTSVGRLFDAVASLLGIAQESRFEGEAAMRLETAAAAAGQKGGLELRGGDWRPMVEQLVKCDNAGAAAAGFHTALADWIVEVAREIGMPHVVLSGGCFQNSILTELACARLEGAGFHVHTHQRIPPNDGGIALGQAVVAGAGVAERLAALGGTQPGISGVPRRRSA
jgi:hydrogenase maturation protein HypF